MSITQSDIQDALSSDIPLANRPATLWGVAITIEVLALIAVSMRLHARKRLTHGFGADDVFVVLAALAAMIGTIVVCFLPSAGLGKHQLTLTVDQIVRFFKYVLGSIVAYVLSVTLVKISILFQYIRLTSRDQRAFRRICGIMIGLCSAWGVFFFFTLMLGCVPLEGYWNPLVKSKCILFGSKVVEVRVQAYIAQSTSNLILDVIVFAMPLYLLRNTEVSNQSKLGLFGVFAMGSFVIVIAILRLASITKGSLGFLQPIIDVTFNTSLPIIWSCIEANVALICASIPVFWPVLSELAFGKIVVSTDIEVRSDVRSARHSFYSRRNNYRMELRENPFPGMGTNSSNNGSNNGGGGTLSALSAGLRGTGNRTFLDTSRSDDDEQELTQSLSWRGAYGKTETEIHVSKSRRDS